LRGEEVKKGDDDKTEEDRESINLRENKKQEEETMT
jgi:hypothetical protein